VKNLPTLGTNGGLKDSKIKVSHVIFLQIGYSDEGSGSIHHFSIVV
jgi:hypothetical protein